MRERSSTGRATNGAETKEPAVGELLRRWRNHRRRSQLDVALDAEVSQRHLSFVESGRAAPSRSLLLRLVRELEVPLREQNRLLVAGGFAPVYRERSLDDPDLAAARRAVERVLAAHEPHPALAVDRHWNQIFANRAVTPLLAGAAEHLLQPPINVLRFTLHPEGLAPRILNYRACRGHLLRRLRAQIDHWPDSGLLDLLTELESYPPPPGAAPAPAAVPSDPSPESLGGIALLMEIESEAGPLRFLTTTTVFGSPYDVLLSELAIESFFPADDATAAVMRAAVEP